MADEVYKKRKKVSPGFENDTEATEQASPPEGNPLERIQQMQNAMAKETGQDAPEVMSKSTASNASEKGFEISGNVPDSFKQALAGRVNEVENNQEPLVTNNKLNLPQEGQVVQKQKARTTPDVKVQQTSSRRSDELTSTLEKVKAFQAYDEVELPSKSKFYETIPPVIHVRPMTGEEENILATPRFVKKGKAIDKIFENVIQERIDTSELLSVDRTYLLIFLRGISYTPEYDVEVKCPACDAKFNTMVDLNMLDVDMCPNEFGTEKLEGVLPRTGLSYKYRLATGDDEQAVTRHRDMRIREFGDQSEDDTLLYRSSILLEYIDQVDNQQEMMVLLRNLPVEDVNYIRNVINEPPFGVNTDVGIICPACNEEFEISLPLEANFFFPRKKAE